METIKFDAADGIGWLVMNRPERMNGMTNRMLIETHDCLAAVSQRTDVRVIVLARDAASARVRTSSTTPPAKPTWPVARTTFASRCCCTKCRS
jgi:1,4-dihydroxy-2-naphthoyl-CoA synthase